MRSLAQPLVRTHSLVVCDLFKETLAFGLNFPAEPARLCACVSARVAFVLPLQISFTPARSLVCVAASAQPLARASECRKASAASATAVPHLLQIEASMARQHNRTPADQLLADARLQLAAAVEMKRSKGTLDGHRRRRLFTRISADQLPAHLAHRPGAPVRHAHEKGGITLTQGAQVLAPCAMTRESSHERPSRWLAHDCLLLLPPPPPPPPRQQVARPEAGSRARLASGDLYPPPPPPPFEVSAFNRRRHNISF